MRHAFLALLARAPAHGYELKLALEQTFGGVWPPLNAGQVYTTLARLEKDGLVEGSLVAQSHRADKRVYSITPAGLTALEQWVAAPSEAPRLRDDFFLKLAFAHTAGLNSANDPAVLIDRQRRHCLRTLRELNDLSARAEAAGNRSAVLLAEGAILHLQADLTWLDLLDASFKS
jgi:DNA-binding PadR family transcriptional regulator